MKRGILISHLLIAVALVPACVKPYHASSVALLQLTKAAQSQVAYHHSTETDEHLLEAVYTENPGLRRDLDRFLVRSKRDGNDVVILVCSPDGKTGLLEDASWTPKVDRKWHRTDKKHPCVFDPLLKRQR